MIQVPDYSDAHSSSSDFNINSRQQEHDNIVIIEESEEEMKVQLIEYQSRGLTKKD